MNVETKSVTSDITEYIKFGWEHTEDSSVRHGPVHHKMHILTRDKDMPNYSKIVSLESKYFSLKAQKKHYEPIDGLWCLVAFLCFIFPGIIYIVIKTKQKKSIEEHNANIQRQMNGILKETKCL